MSDAITIQLDRPIWFRGAALDRGARLAVSLTEWETVSYAAHRVAADAPPPARRIPLGAMTGIPKLIHFVWTGAAELPEWGRRHMDAFARLNPGYAIKLHGDAALAPQYRAAWERFPLPVQRADLIRYSVLEREGGWYFDLDFLPFRPLDEAEHAWQLDGARLAVARQHGHRSGDAAPYANAPLACAPGLPLWGAVAEYVVAAITGNRCALGPLLVNRLVEDHPDNCAIMGWPWWFPSSIEDAPARYAAASRRPERARHFAPETGGQLPYAMHCWADAGTPMPAPRATNRVWILHDPAGPELGAEAHAARWPDSHPMSAAREGLAAAGYEVLAAAPPQVNSAYPFFPDGAPEALLVWNGLRPPHQSRVTAAEAAGVPVWRIEHGFLDRRRYVQCDCRGILHWASWAADWNGPPPPAAAARLAAAWPAPLLPPVARTAGPILVVGQMDGDTQMMDSPVREQAELLAAVAAALPPAVAAAEYRPHPRGHALGHYPLPLAPAGEPLADALARCRFVVTINSNTIVEATALGVPCLAFGPSTAITAGVARQATVETLADDLAAMYRGWTPAPDAARNYLLHLACRQYSTVELRDPNFWRERIGA